MTVNRRLAAILAADVAGYARLIGADEEGTLGRLRYIRAEVIDPRITEHHGRLVKTTGDGFLIEFGSVVDALRCATEFQREMAERNSEMPINDRLEFRIGIHQGDIVVEDRDIFGDGVNIAARLEALAEPGGVYVSARVQEDVAGRLDVTFEDLGEQNLKHIARPIRVYRVRLTASEPVAPIPVLNLPDKPSIAVLPFANLSNDPDQEFFSEGIAEDIITALSRIRWFFVIARNSTFTYKDRAVDVKQVGRELGVRYVLEGSVRRSGNRVRVSAQLVEAETGNHVWAERYDRELADIFAVQDEITERVVAAIEPELYAAEQIRSQSKPPSNLDAWECVIRALSCIGQGTREQISEGEALCRRAVAIAPGYARAHSLLAWALLRRSGMLGDLRALMPDINAATQTALALDDRDAWAHFARSNLLTRMRRFDEAVRASRRALELNPNFALAHAFLGVSLAHQGARQQAVESAQQALRLSPRDRHVGTYASITMANVNFMSGDYSECIAWACNTIENSPEWLIGHVFLTAGLAMQGDLIAAAAARDALFRLRPQFSLRWMSENQPPTGELAERLREGLSKAGVPEA